MIIPKSNEIVLSTYTGRWLWCHDPEDGWEGYVHLECDMITDENGNCIGCGAQSPASTGESRPVGDRFNCNVEGVH